MNGATWAVFLLPHMEQDNLYRKWKLGLTYYNPANDDARVVPVKSYFCPTRRDAKKNAISISGDVTSKSPPTYNKHTPGATSDYAVVGNPPLTDAATNPGAGGLLHGVFGDTGGRRFAEIPDGLSNTLMVGEKHIPRGKMGVGWWDCSTNNGNYPRCWSRAVGASFRIPHLTTNPTETNWLFGSSHAEVVQFVFADGSVRAVPTTIDRTTFIRLTVCDDGEVVPEW